MCSHSSSLANLFSVVSNCLRPLVCAGEVAVIIIPYMEINLIEHTSRILIAVCILVDWLQDSSSLRGVMSFLGGNGA
jgi:hypothetical protein